MNQCRFNVKKDDLLDGKIIELLETHHAEMHLYSPPESIHALDESTFKDSSITYWGARGVDLMGCGALKVLSDDHGEIKAMRTSREYLRCGVATKILEAILAEAVSRQYVRLSLETGSHESFFPAIKLYKKYGFIDCSPFGVYTLDPHSVFLTKQIGNI